jgi:ketosteroid isomerase-like protein
LGNHHGKDAIRLLFEENRKNLPGYRLDPDEVIDAGDKVIVVAHLGGAGATSGIALDDRIAFVATMKDGLIVQQQTFRNKTEALEAVGLRE